MSKNWELAYEDYKNGMKYKDIAKKYNVSLNTVKSWKTRKWNSMSMRTVENKKVCTQKRKRGGQPGNQNAKNHGATLRNKNAEKHGLFSKYLPKDTLDIIEAVEVKDPLDILWENIQIQYAAIIRAQNIMHVKSQSDHTKELVKETNGDTSSTEEWEIQYSWDKQANFLKAQSRAMATLTGMINKYTELIHKNWDTATEEQRERIELLKAQRQKLTGEDQELEDTSEVEAEIYGE